LISGFVIDQWLGYWPVAWLLTSGLIMNVFLLIIKTHLKD